MGIQIAHRADFSRLEEGRSTFTTGSEVVGDLFSHPKTSRRSARPSSDVAKLKGDSRSAREAIAVTSTASSRTEWTAA